MNEPQTKAALITAAKELKRASPERWGAFVDALGAHASLSMTKMLRAQPTELTMMQGYAQATVNLHEFLTKLDENAAAFAARTKEKNNGV